MPPMKRMGMNTAASEMVIDRMVKEISRDPSKAALHRPLPPFSMWADDVLRA